MQSIELRGRFDSGVSVHICPKSVVVRTKSIGYVSVSSSPMAVQSLVDQHEIEVRTSCSDGSGFGTDSLVQLRPPFVVTRVLGVGFPDTTVMQSDTEGHVTCPVSP